MPRVEETIPPHLVDEADLTYLHVFPYSPRQGTPAARMPEVPKALRKERATRLRQAGERALNRFLDREVTCQSSRGLTRR